MYWTEEEKNKLKELYPYYENSYIAKVLNKTKTSIEKAGHRYKLKKEWGTGTKPIEIPKDFKKKVELGLTYLELSTIFNLNIDQVKWIKIKLGLTNSNLWTKEEVEFLKDNKDKYSTATLANKLNKSKSAIEHKLHKLQIKKNTIVENKLWNENNCSLLKSLWGTMSFPDIVSCFKTTERAILVKASRLGLLNKKATYPEKELNKILKELNITFTEQHSIKPYRADFFIEPNIVLEAMGDYWHKNPKVYKECINESQEQNYNKDKKRKKFLNDLGYKVVYIWESDIKFNREKVKTIIKNILHAR